MPELIVAIATSGRPVLLERTLDSLSRCHRPSSYAGTVVVENGASACAESIARSYDAAYLHVSRRNKSHALNRLLDQVGDVLIYFSDDDVRFDVGALNAIAAAAGGTTAGEFFGGSVRVDFEREPPQWLRHLLPPSARGFEVADAVAWERWPFFLGCNWAAFAADIREAGCFDVQFGPGSPKAAVGQERAMQERLRQMGVRARRVPEAIVWHWVPVERCSPQWIVRRRYRNGVNAGLRWRTARRHGILTPLIPWWTLIRSVPPATLRWVSGGRRGRLEAKAQMYFHLGMVAAGRNRARDGAPSD